MLISEMKTGEIFCIEGSISYPKLKLNIGYVDMRDEIKNTYNLNFEANLMTQEEIEKEFAKYDMNINDIENLKKDLMEKFN
jgi:hypothetical protein